MADTTKGKTAKIFRSREAVEVVHAIYDALEWHSKSDEVLFYKDEQTVVKKRAPLSAGPWGAFSISGKDKKIIEKASVLLSQQPIVVCILLYFKDKLWYAEAITRSHQDSQTLMRLWQGMIAIQETERKE